MADVVAFEPRRSRPPDGVPGTDDLRAAAAALDAWAMRMARSLDGDVGGAGVAMHFAAATAGHIQQVADGLDAARDGGPPGPAGRGAS